MMGVLRIAATARGRRSRLLPIGELPPELPADAQVELFDYVDLDLTAEGSLTAAQHFDLVCTYTATHEDTTTLSCLTYYSGSGTGHKLRFGGTKLGRWTITTAGSGNSGLDSKEFIVDVVAPTNSLRRGYRTAIAGSERYWARQTADGAELFLPQLVMFGAPGTMAGWPNLTADLNMVMDDHGFTGVHIMVFGNWFDHTIGIGLEVSSSHTLPDPTTFTYLETVFQAVVERGGHSHIWMWGDHGRSQTPLTLSGGKRGTIEQRLRRYIAGRMGPVAGWSLGYGYDLQEWATATDIELLASDFQGWCDYSHWYGGRYGGPTQADINNGILTAGAIAWPAPGGYRGWEWWTDHIENYTTMDEMIAYRDHASLSDAPHMGEDRYRRFTPDSTPKHFLADEQVVLELAEHGILGIAAIWGYYLTVNSELLTEPFPNAALLRTFGQFWSQDGNRFDKVRVHDAALHGGNTHVRRSADNRYFAAWRVPSVTTLTVDYSSAPGNVNIYRQDMNAAYGPVLIFADRTARSETFTMPSSGHWAIWIEPAGETVTTDQSAYTIGTPIIATITGGPGNPENAVGIYEQGANDLDNALTWVYLASGTQTLPESGTDAGSVELPTFGLAEGSYEVHLLDKAPIDFPASLAVSAPVSLTEGAGSGDPFTWNMADNIGSATLLGSASWSGDTLISGGGANGAWWAFNQALGDRFSIVAWFNPSAIVDFGKVLAVPSQADWSPPYGWGIDMRSNGSLRLLVVDAGTFKTAQTDASFFNLDHENRIGVVRDGTQVQFWRNGELVVSRTLSIAGAEVTDSYPYLVLLNRHPDDPGEGVPGTMARATLYGHTVRSSAQMIADTEGEAASPPLAADDSYIVTAGAGTQQFNVQENDTNLTGAELTELIPGSLTGPGSVGVNADGKRINYTPPSTGSGSASFSYQLNRGGVLSNTALVSISIQDAQSGTLPFDGQFLIVAAGAGGAGNFRYTHKVAYVFVAEHTGSIRYFAWNNRYDGPSGNVGYHDGNGGSIRVELCPAVLANINSGEKFIPDDSTILAFTPTIVEPIQDASWAPHWPGPGAMPTGYPYGFPRWPRLQFNVDVPVVKGNVYAFVLHQLGGGGRVSINDAWSENWVQDFRSPYEPWKKWHITARKENAGAAWEERAKTGTTDIFPMMGAFVYGYADGVFKGGVMIGDDSANAWLPLDGTARTRQILSISGGDKQLLRLWTRLIRQTDDTSNDLVVEMRRAGTVGGSSDEGTLLATKTLPGSSIVRTSSIKTGTGQVPWSAFPDFSPTLTLESGQSYYFVFRSSGTSTHFNQRVQIKNFLPSHDLAHPDWYAGNPRGQHNPGTGWTHVAVGGDAANRNCIPIAVEIVP